ncbi:NUDIX hydrolase [Priestia endophytica]|uniref:NUDIX hydrolase n=1 Tax=Priestia endophytica TaxID=135735 RepID=UPI000F532061|nr:NUDIX domain-containing protein [Priestia endophytica]
MSDYILEIRKKIGSMPLVVSVAGCLIIDDQNRVLLQRRTDNQQWSHPGGAVELGETVEGTVKREVYEETGLKVQDLKFFNIYSGESQHYTYPNGDEVYFVNVIYFCNNYKGVPFVNDQESTELKFCEIESLPELAPTSKEIIADLKVYLNS